MTPYDYIRKHPGQTIAEIAEVLGLNHHVAARSIFQLRAEGKIVRGKSRKCQVLRMLGMTWITKKGAGK